MRAKPTDEDRAAKVNAAKETLTKGVRALQTGDQWKTMLATVAKGARRRLSPRRYSFGNQMIVMMEALTRGVDGEMVGTFRAWEGVGRRVKKGEKAVYILQPSTWTKEVENKAGEKEQRSGVFFRTLPVFLLGQTEGQAIPAAPSLCGEVESDERFEAHLDELRAVALAMEGKPVRSLTVRARKPGDSPGAAGWFVPATGDIVVIDSGNKSLMFKTAVHEVAHALMHSKAGHHEYAQNEVEAESVAFVVSSVFGLDTSAYSFPYVASWAKSEDAAKCVQTSGERIVKAVNTILDALLADEALKDEGEKEAA